VTCPCISTAQARRKRCPRRCPRPFSPSISTQNGSDDMSMCISTARARTKSDISHRNLAKTELVQRSCQVTSYGDLVQRYCLQTSYKDLTLRSPTEIFCGNLL
jgi:hypothetical protein